MMPTNTDNGIKVMSALQEQFITAMHNEQMPAPAWIVNNKLGAQTRMNIYRSNYAGALHAALQAIFPVCERLVGSAFFAGMSNAYISNKQCKTNNLLSYSMQFPKFISNYPPASDLVYLADVTKLELAFEIARYGPNNQRINAEQLATIDKADANEINLKLPHAATLLESVYPIKKIWEVNQDDAAHETISLEQGGIRLIIWREDATIYIDELDNDQWQLLTTVDNNMTLDSFCAQFSDSKDKYQLAQNMIPILIQKGWIMLTIDNNK